eukprot:6301239-Alexandrium_andersonii.AAC.1
MSASLVGSEMCIRDSLLHTKEHPGEWPRRELLHRLAEPRRQHAPAATDVETLVTSGAAGEGERQAVDIQCNTRYSDKAKRHSRATIQASGAARASLSVVR